MAFKEKHILTRFLLVWLSFIKVRGFVVVNEGKSRDSSRSFNKNVRTMESFDRWDEKPKSGAQVGRLLIRQDQASKSHGGGGVSLSSEISSHSQLEDSAYQLDNSGWLKRQPLWGQVYGGNTLYAPTVEKLIGMKPKVDCVGDVMKLTIHGRESLGSNFLIDRGSVPPLPLSQLPSECGHRFLRTWRGFVFIIPIDGCYVMHESDSFILPLLWLGLPVKMSCSPLILAKSEPTVSCYANGMIVKLHGGVSERLKIKVMNEWQPLLKVSGRCGYSLVSHQEGVVIHAPYMPCTEPKDGMFTLRMVVESEFNLSCPARSLSLPIDTPELAHEQIFIPRTTLSPTTITTTTETTQPSSTTSTFKKLPTPPLPYYIPGQPDFKPVPPSYPFLIFPPKRAPTILHQGPKIVGPPIAITQRPQVPVYMKRPQTWYPWYPVPSVPRDPRPAVPQYPRKPLLPPTKEHSPTAPIVSLLKPTGSPQDKLVPPVQWAPMFPPSNMVYPLYPGKPEFVTPSSAVFPPVPYWPHHPQIQQRPFEPHAQPKPKPALPKPKPEPPKPKPEPPKPAPTKTGPQLIRYPWYKPLPPRRSEMPPVPKNDTVSTSEAVAFTYTTYSEQSEQVEKTQASENPHRTVKGPHKNTEPTPSHPKCPEVVHAPALIKASPTPICSSHSCFHCPTLCPGPPSLFYHHHNHHHFGHPPQMSSFDLSSTTKVTGQMLSSPVMYPDSNFFALIKGMGYNYGPLYSKMDLPLASDGTAMQYLVENPPIKNTYVTDTSRRFTGPAMYPYIFSKLESTADSRPPTMKPADVAPVIRHLEPFQNKPVAEPVAYSNLSPNPAVNQAEMQQYVMGRDTEPMLVAPNNVPPFIPLKPALPSTHGKNAFLNYWQQAANLNVKPPMSNSQMSLPQPPSNRNPFEPSTALIQPKETPDENPPQQLSFHPSMQIRDSVPVVNHQLYFPPNGESVNPIFRGQKLFNTNWVPAVQSNKDALLSSSQTDGYMGRPSTVVQQMWRARNRAN